MLKVICNIALFAFIMLMNSGCSPDKFQKTDKKNWVLSWSDEFNEGIGKQPDPAKWTYDLGRGQDGWGNQELQVYTNHPENISQDGEGNLVITAIRNGNTFTSARIKTQGLFSQKYGRFETRLKTPYGPGLWPAFWLLGDNIDTDAWPLCGEIDVMELRGQEPNAINGSIHGPGYSAGNAITKKYTLPNGRFDNEFYIYAVEWDAEKIDFFVNDFLYHRIEKADVPGTWVFDNPFFMILNVAVGGNYVGFPTDQTPFPQKMTIDYVRVYTESK